LTSPDFLRHIVAKVLTPNSLDLKRLDEARRLLGKAEAKYKFSSFGGEPKRLIDYLLSPDFTDLILVLGPDLTKKLLETIVVSFDDEQIQRIVSKIKEEVDGYSTSEEYNPNRMVIY